jgi:hypothetical protein
MHADCEWTSTNTCSFQIPKILRGTEHAQTVYNSSPFLLPSRGLHDNTFLDTTVYNTSIQLYMYMYKSRLTCSMQRQAHLYLCVWYQILLWCISPGCLSIQLWVTGKSVSMPTSYLLPFMILCKMKHTVVPCPRMSRGNHLNVYMYFHQW